MRWHPMRESFWALLMCAQYRAGRQADALASYQRARNTLADELGIDPGPTLQELERLILAQDRSLDLPGVSTFLPARTERGSYPERVALVERADLLATLGGLHEEALAGSGRLVLVNGEAGVGKSALVREWAADAGSRARVLWGACDPLSSPRPLGPLVDVAPHLDPQVGELLRSGERDGLFEAALAALETMGPTVLVIEDLHWADMSTLDLVRFLARRLEGTHVFVVATYRDEHLPPSDPSRVMLGDIASQSVVRRVEVPLLSAAAVAELAAGSGIDAGALYRETGGNAFFVTEVVASGGSAAAGHRPGRRPGARAAALAAGPARPGVRGGRGLAGRALARARHARRDGRRRRRVRDLGHAALRRTGVRLPARDRPAVACCRASRRGAWVRCTGRCSTGCARCRCPRGRSRGSPSTPRWPATARRSSSSPSRPATPRPASGRTARRRSSTAAPCRTPTCSTPTPASSCSASGRCECQVSDDHEHAIEAWERALVLLRAAGRDLDVVDALLGIDESYYTIGDNSRGSAFVDEALEVLDGTGPSRQLALAIGRRGSHHLRASETPAAIPWLERALAMGRAVGDHEVVARAVDAPGPGAGSCSESARRAWHRCRRDSGSRSSTTSRTAPRGPTRRSPHSPGSTSTLPRRTPSSRTPSGTPPSMTSTATSCACSRARSP